MIGVEKQKDQPLKKDVGRSKVLNLPIPSVSTGLILAIGLSDSRAQLGIVEH